MMRDVLRAARVSTAFLAAAEVWMVETSVPLRTAQTAMLAGAPIRWVDHLSNVPADAPIILLANEFLDCLPIDQWVCSASACRERRIGLGEGGELAFIVEGVDARRRPANPIDMIVERSSALVAMGRTVGGLLTRASGAALFIDYGRDEPGFGDTLQALRGHRKESPLAHPGRADLTAHVDFPAFVGAARAGGAQAAPLLAQGVFLRQLGIEIRAAALASANPAKADLIARQCERLVGPDQMGELFKVARIHSPGFEAP
jgi:SAM-dependent MidA family methyltransferase